MTSLHLIHAVNIFVCAFGCVSLLPCLLHAWWVDEVFQDIKRYVNEDDYVDEFPLMLTLIIMASNGRCGGCVCVWGNSATGIQLTANQLPDLLTHQPARVHLLGSFQPNNH